MSYSDDIIRNLSYRIQDLGNKLDSKKEDDKKYIDALDFSSMLKMLEMGLIKKEDVLNSNLYKNYISSKFNSNSKTR